MDVTDASADEKIELLVHSVLEAVDARLAAVRQEVHQLGAEIEERHQDVLRQIQDIERRLERRAVEPVVGADTLAARMEQATQVLLERIEAMHQRDTMATNERLAVLDEAVEKLSGSAVSAPVASPAMLPRLDVMNAPFRLPPITTEQPVLATAPSAQSIAVAAVAPDDEIDIDQLADLLTARLGQMSLAPRPL